MQPSLPEALLSQFSDCVAARIGLHFSRDRWPDLERGIGRAAPALGFADAADCIRWLLSTDLNRSQIEVLASHLTIGETYFFREPKSFEALQYQVLPDLIRARRQAARYLRLWSAACCTGEEAYSLAILLDRLLPDLGDWQITILATDINPQFLKRAAAGVYGEWSFRGVDPALRAGYFTRRADGSYEILPRIKQMVTFAYHNLVEDPFPAFESNTNAMDLVLCRNVLMYFSPDCARTVVRHLYRSVIDGGWLLPGSVEAGPGLFAPFVFANLDGAILYRKVEAAITTAPVTLAPPVAGPPRPAVPVATVLRRSPPAAPAAGSGIATQARERTAAMLSEQGRYGEAAEQLVAHLALHPDDEHAMTLLARTYANQGRLAEALEWCTKAIACDRLAAGKHYLLAMIQQERGDLAAAAASLRRALFLEPQLVVAQLALANIARIQENLLEAKRHYRNALALLQGREPEEVLAESDGLTVRRLLEIARHATLAELDD